MSKKPSKSIQAIIITLIAGMIIPKIFDISGNALLDKFLWKGVLSASFSVATIIVGLLYAGRFITGKVAGGKSRISIYFILIAIFASAASAVCAFIREISPILKMALALITILAITLLIVKLIRFCFKVKRDFKITQERSVTKKNPLTLFCQFMNRRFLSLSGHNRHPSFFCQPCNHGLFTLVTKSVSIKNQR